MKVEMFHEFYQRIEEIQTTIIEADPLVIENIDCQMRIDDDSNRTDFDTVNRNESKVNVPGGTKYDSQFEEKFLPEEPDESHSYDAASK